MRGEGDVFDAGADRGEVQRGREERQFGSQQGGVAGGMHNLVGEVDEADAAGDERRGEIARGAPQAAAVLVRGWFQGVARNASASRWTLGEPSPVHAFHPGPA